MQTNAVSYGSNERERINEEEKLLKILPSACSTKVMVPSTPAVPLRTQTALAGICITYIEVIRQEASTR
jgi:hypothetical protein